MEALRAVGFPGKERSQAGDRQRCDEEQRDEPEPRKRRDGDRQQEAESQENQTLNESHEGAAKHFAQNHRPPRNWRDEHALQKSFATVLDDRNRREDGRKEHDQEQTPGKKVSEKVLRAGL